MRVDVMDEVTSAKLEHKIWVGGERRYQDAISSFFLMKEIINYFPTFCDEIICVMQEVIGE